MSQGSSNQFPTARDKAIGYLRDYSCTLKRQGYKSVVDDIAEVIEDLKKT